MKNIIFSSLALFLFSLKGSVLIAQDKPQEYRIYGMVTDSITMKPSGYAILYLQTNNTSLNTNLTKNDGTLDFTIHKPLKYSISVVSNGYKAQTIIVEFPDTRIRNKDSGTVYQMEEKEKAQLDHTTCY